MNLNKLFIFFSFSFLFGVFFSNFIENFDMKIFFLIFIFIFLIWVLFLVKKHQKIVLLIAFWVFCWTLYSGVKNISIIEKNQYISQFYWKELFIKAEIIDLYKQNDFWKTYKAKLDNKLDIDFLLQTSSNLNLEKWQKVSFVWNILKIDNFVDTFNYVKYLQSQNIYFKAKPYNIDLKWSRKLSKYEVFVINLRKIVLSNIDKIYPKRESILLSGLLIWEKAWLPQDMFDAYSRSGLMHIITVSWSNISLIILFLSFIFRLVPAYLRFTIISLFIIFYMFLTWMWISVIRASIMWILGYYILISWRKTDNLALILLTAFLMVLFNPLVINYDISFHMSFLAVIWILYTKRFWERLFKFLPKKFAIRDSFVVAISATTTIFPIMLFNFWYISVLNPIVSMITWWILPIAMFFWTLSVIVNIFFETLWYYLGFIWYFLLNFINRVAFYVSDLKFSVIDFDFWEYAKFLEIFYFLLLSFLIIYYNIKKKPQIIEKVTSIE